MKLANLYTNQPELFVPIQFSSGLNVIVAEIRLPENKDKDTHNLGKTTLGRVIDFCFLTSTDADYFLIKRFDIFGKFVFFLEIELFDGSFVTVRRAVREATKISFKRHAQRDRDFSDLAPDAWDHSAIAFERARKILDGMLGLRELNPWTFRNIVGYLLRSQDDFRDVFHLKKYAGSHSDWKPFVAHLLGFNSSVIAEHYTKEEELAKKQADEILINQELGGSVEDISKIEGILLLKKREAQKKQDLLDAFDFRQNDKDKTRLLIEGMDERIARLNAERYSLGQNKKKIMNALEGDEILFDPASAKKLFAEAGVLFEGQLKKDFEQLISFNKAITDERRVYLREELAEIEGELKDINSELSTLGKRRSETLSFLSGTDSFLKYKRVTDELVSLKADITSLERQRGFLHRLQELRTQIRALSEEKRQLQERIEADVEKQNSDTDGIFATIRVYFSEIVEEVIGRKALLTVAPNQLGHLEFRAEILDDSGNVTSADLGNTYRKLLCIAMDLALLRAHSDECYPKFVYHDGVFEALDDRKKENLLSVIRAYSDFGLQHIITLIDSDLPNRPAESAPVFEQAEIVLTLHDEGDDGRLFKIKSW